MRTPTLACFIFSLSVSLILLIFFQPLALQTLGLLFQLFVSVFGPGAISPLAQSFFTFECTAPPYKNKTKKKPEALTFTPPLLRLQPEPSWRG